MMKTNRFLILTTASQTSWASSSSPPLWWTTRRRSLTLDPSPRTRQSTWKPSPLHQAQCLSLLFRWLRKWAQWRQIIRHPSLRARWTPKSSLESTTSRSGRSSPSRRLGLKESRLSDTKNAMLHSRASCSIIISKSRGKWRKKKIAYSKSTSRKRRWSKTWDDKRSLSCKKLAKLTLRQKQPRRELNLRSSRNRRS